MGRVFFNLILLLGFGLFGQESNNQKELLKKASDNIELLDKNPKKAFHDANLILKEAQRFSIKEAELIAINTKCGYYRIENDFKKMMESAERLFKKSSSYKFPRYQVIAKRHLFESYLFTGLPQKAFRELEQGRELIKNLDDTDPLNTIEKVNLFVAYSNYYLLKEDYKNQLQYIKLAEKEIEKLPNNDYKQKLLYVHHSNLAASYNKNDVKDSAKYYAKLSASKDEEFGRNEVRFNNLTVLGDVGIKESNYKEALTYFEEAEKVSGYKNHLDIEQLYDNIIKANKKLGREDLVNVYQSKKDSLKLTISENQNKSLHKLLNESKESDLGKYKYLILVLFLVLLIFSFFVIRRNRILLRQEKISNQYLARVTNSPTGEDYSKLLQLLKDNEPTFMIYFEETFPGFSSSLKKINPEISDSEIEFSALLKLKIPTKDIAKYKFIAPQTVRNKKNIIKNKLQIPKESDIYEWFDKL